MTVLPKIEYLPFHYFFTEEEVKDGGTMWYCPKKNKTVPICDHPAGEICPLCQEELKQGG